MYDKAEALECHVDCEEGQMSATPQRSLPQPLSKRGVSGEWGVVSRQCRPRRAERGLFVIVREKKTSPTHNSLTSPKKGKNFSKAWLGESHAGQVPSCCQMAPPRSV